MPPADERLLIYLSAWIAMLGWFGGTATLIATRTGRLAQWLWAGGSGLQVLHVAIAFHVAHDWSHTAAFEHTKRVGGFGEGVYVNYAFTAVWLFDAAWLCLSPRTYRRRPNWLTWLIHGFMSFIVFNAMVVFGTWVARGMFAAFVVILLRLRL